MTYTIRIRSGSPKAESIIKMLQELKNEYDFIDIIEDKDYNENEEYSPEFLEELDRRSDYMLQHPEEGRDWDEVKKRLTGE